MKSDSLLNNSLLEPPISDPFVILLRPPRPQPYQPYQGPHHPLSATRATVGFELLTVRFRRATPYLLDYKKVSGKVAINSDFRPMIGGEREIAKKSKSGGDLLPMGREGLAWERGWPGRQEGGGSEGVGMIRSGHDKEWA